jgi:hypothetical protein
MTASKLRGLKMTSLLKTEMTLPASEVSDSVESCAILFEAAGRGGNVANALFEAVVAIQRGGEGRAVSGSIDLAQRHRLLTASVRAQWAAAEHLPIEYDRSSLNAGMCALAYQITIWAESVEQTSRRKPDDLLDIRDATTVFQNELENIVLRERMAGRARQLDPASQTSLACGLRPRAVS